MVGNQHHFVQGRLTGQADVVILAEAPVLGRIVDAASVHQPFKDDSGKIIDSTLIKLRGTPKYEKLNIQKTYAVLCTSLAGDKEPSKDVLERCKSFLHQGLEVVSQSKTPVILAMGMTAVKALGIKAKKLKDVMSRVLTNVPIGDKHYTVVATMSTKQLVAMAGMYNTFLGDLTKALDIACEGGKSPQVPLEVLTRDYVFPKTIEEVRNLCDSILAYREEDMPPERWAISVDTETTTKFPHRDKLKLLCISFSWAPGKACAIPMWHKDTPYDPERAIPYVRAVLECAKPKVFQNGKYDLKVFKKLGWRVENYAWDSMLGEHALEEDKKGQYGLKQMTAVFFPEFSGYADALQEILDKEEGDSQLDNIRKAKKEAEKNAEPELLGHPKRKSPKKKDEKDGGFEKLPLDMLLRYAAIDTDMTLRLTHLQRKRMIDEQNEVIRKKNRLLKEPHRAYPVPHLCNEKEPVRALVKRTGIPVSQVLANMEFRGIKVDRSYLADLQKSLNRVITDAESELMKMVSREKFSLNSARDIASVLFSEGFIHPTTGKRTHYDVVSKTEKGQAQTTDKVLKWLVARYDCPFSTQKRIYAKAYKAKNTFCQNVWDLSALDGSLHTNYNIHGTATGRLSSNDENMQNIPKKLANVNIKKIFIPSSYDLAFVNCDAKNAEVRIFAAYSGDAELIRSINDGLDTHCFFADAIVKGVRRESGAAAVLESMGLDDGYPLTYDDFKAREKLKDKDYRYGEMLDKFRTAIKRVVFGILYGAGKGKIAETIGISEAQATAIIEMLFTLYPSIPRYIAQTKWELNTLGYVETYFGRRRRFNVAGAPKYIKGRAERQGVNFKIQSTSSDIVLDCLVALEGPLERDLGGRLLLTVHDSIGFEAPKKYLSQLPDFLKYHLETRVKGTCPWLPVDFKWDFEVGDNYGELMSLEAYLQGLKAKQVDSLARDAYTEEEVRTELASIEEAA